MPASDSIRRVVPASMSSWLTSARRRISVVGNIRASMSSGSSIIRVRAPASSAALWASLYIQPVVSMPTTRSEPLQASMIASDFIHSSSPETTIWKKLAPSTPRRGTQRGGVGVVAHGVGEAQHRLARLHITQQ